MSSLLQSHFFLLIVAAVKIFDKEYSYLTVHLDNQFRLLCENMLEEIREKLQIVLEKKKKYHRGLIINLLMSLNINCNVLNRRQA